MSSSRVINLVCCTDYQSAPCKYFSLPVEYWADRDWFQVYPHLGVKAEELLMTWLLMM